MRSPISIFFLFAVLLLAGCGEALTVTEAEWAACDSKVTELSGRAAKGEGTMQSLRNYNGTKSIRIIYKETPDTPGIQCDLVAGKVVSIVKFEQLYRAKGKSI